MLEFLQRSINYTTRVRLDGARFRIPVLGGVEVRGVRETFKTRVIRRFADGTGTFIDAGTNLGQTLLDLRVSQPTMPYLGFDPNPRAVAYMQSLIQANRFINSRVICAALSDRLTTLSLFSLPGDAADPASTLISKQWPNGPRTATQPVVVLPFDQIAASLGAHPIGFIKIDVEGAELDVLRGMRQSLTKDRPSVLCEVLPPCGGANAEESTTRRRSIMELLASLDYRVYHVAIDGSIHPATEFSAGSYSPKESWDYLFLPAERPADGAM